MIGNEDFIILISYIQTVLNILGYKTDNIDQLISKYADEKWISVDQYKLDRDNWLKQA